MYTCKEELLGFCINLLEIAPCPEGAPVRYSNARGFDWGVYGVAAVGMYRALITNSCLGRHKPTLYVLVVSKSWRN